MTSYPIHPACSAWPAMREAALRELADDIKIHGQLEPAAITPDGELLDGRNREAACALNGIELKTVVYDGDPIAFSISKNKHRRHMDKIALAFVGAELATLVHGGFPGNNNAAKTKTATAVSVSRGKTIFDVSTELNVAADAIDNARAIMDKGTAEIIDLAKSKRVGLRSAADYVRHTPKEEQVADPAVIKGSTRSPRRDDARPAIRAKLERGEPINIRKLQAQLGMSAQPIIVSEAYERGRLEVLALPLAQRQELMVEYAKKVALKDLAENFNRIVGEELQKRLHARDAADVLAIDQANEVLSHVTGRMRPPLTAPDYMKVLWALHPDNQSETKTAEAFIIMRRKKHILCDAGPIVRKSPPLPAVPVRKTARRG